MKKLLFLSTLLAAALTATAQYTIYPVPQQMTAGEGTAQFSEKVCLVCDPQIDAATIERAQQVLREHGLSGSIDTGAQQCTSVIYLKVDPAVAKASKFDAHTISLKAMSNGMADLTITGQNTDATFFGLASLEQMLDEKDKSSMPCVEIYDWADQQSRGLVEGYYGYPYSVAVKKDLMRFMMRLKMNTYLYGAKSDPYHSQSWKDPYPTSISAEEEEGGWVTQNMLRDICQVSQQTKVNFIWAIHPGNNFLGSTTVIQDIMSKFQNMHSLGVRQFAVFVDDVGVPSSDADLQKNADRLTELQRTIESTFNKAGTAPADTVRPLHFVPQIYCRGFAKDEDQFQRFFRALSTTPKNIVVYTTGWGVWSVPNVGDYNNTAQHLGREVAWWWNYPCNDNSDAQIYPMDMYQNFVDLPQINGSSTLPKDMQGRGMGIVSNPMQQGEVAKTALFSVADYAWHCAGFENKSSWEASFRFVLPNEELAAAYRRVAPYLTYNDPATGSTSLNTTYLKKNATALLADIETLATMAESQVESERLLWHDLRPWILKLRQMLATALKLNETKGLAKTTSEGNLNEEKWNAYVECLEMIDDLNTNPDYIVKTLEGMNYKNVGSHLVKPSQKTLATTIATLKTSAISGFIPSRSTRATYIANTGNTGTVSTITTPTTGYYISQSARTYQPDEYVGISLPTASRINVTAQDTLLNGRELRVSADGKEWTTLAPGEQPEDYVAHIILVNTSTKTQSTKLTKDVLQITLKVTPTISSVDTPAGEVWNNGPLANLTDGNYSTVFSMNVNQKTGDTYVLNLSDEAPLSRVRLVLATTNGDYMNTGRVEISSNKTTWTRLSPMGTTKNTFTINDMKELASESRILDFDAKGRKARYIRLYNQSANTSKWLRIFEFQPIYDIKAPEAEDAAGTPLDNVCDGAADTYDEVRALKYYLRQVNDAQSITLLTNRGILTFGIDDPRTTVWSMDWGTETLRIYEAYATYSTQKYDITDIQSAATQPLRESRRLYDLSGRTLTTPVRGITIQNGTKIIR